MDMHFYATFLPVKVKNGHFHVIMHFYAIFFTYVDLAKKEETALLREFLFYSVIF